MTRNRTTHTIELKPVAGARFQPTGFPDLGAALFQAWDSTNDGWVDALHVESPQSMANHLEATTWDRGAQEQPTPLHGLPYVRVVDAEDGGFVTSSRLEAHRLASAYIMDSAVDDGGVTGRSWLPGLLGAVKGESKGFDHRRVAREVCRLDPVSLVHGVFFAQKQWGWQPKIARAVTCFIDAHNVRAAHSGGVKTDSFSTQGGSEESKGAEEGYGMVPHQRLEFTAAQITAYVTIDHEQIRSYGLGEPGTELVEALIDYELAHVFRGGGLRLRTACDLVPADEVQLDTVPTVERAEERVAGAISGAGDLLGEVTTLTYSVSARRKAPKQ